MEARAELLETARPQGRSSSCSGDHPIGTRIEADRTGGEPPSPASGWRGNLTDPSGAGHVSAAAAGLMAGATINFDLVLEQARKPRLTQGPL